MRILLLCEYPALNGGERSLLASLRHGHAAGCEYLALCPPGPLENALTENGVRTIPWAKLPPGEARLKARREQLAETLAAAAVNLVHANSLAMSRVAGPVTRTHGVPALGHLRDIVRLSARAIQDLTAVDQLLAVSEATRSFHISQGLPRERIAVLYNGVDFVDLARTPERKAAARAAIDRELRLPADAPWLLGVGQLSLRKGWDTLLAAWPAVIEQFRGAQLLLAGERHGDKPEVVAFCRQLRQTAAQPPWAGRIHFLGRRDDVARLMLAADLLVHPARQEPLGRVLLEALAAGLPVAATEVGGTREIFPPPLGAAELVSPDDPPSLAAAILAVLRDRQRAKNMADRAWTHGRSRFDAERQGPRLISWYRRWE